MDQIEVEHAKTLTGLRLAVTAHVPNPFCEAAKSVFHVKGIPFVPVAQRGGQPNAELVAWTGHRNAPVAVYNDERPRAGWAEILSLAERIAPTPALLPEDREARALVFGLINEICGEDGLAWNFRFLTFPEQAANAAPEPGTWDGYLKRDYGASKEALAQAPVRAKAVLRMLGKRLNAQARAGSPYFVGNSLTATDIYWASFSIAVVQLPEDRCATPSFLRKSWAQMSAALSGSLDPILIKHRDFIYNTYLQVPLDF